MNLDNSPSVRLAPLVSLFPGKRGEFARTVKQLGIRYGTALSIPLPDASADVVYSSHMMEHLDRREVALFLKEARRVLQPGGILRCALPDLRQQVNNYLRHGDADELVETCKLAVPKPNGLLSRLQFLLVGFREHHWMYDSASLRKLLVANGFVEPVELAAGCTTIADPGELNLREREHETLYVEARRP